MPRDEYQQFLCTSDLETWTRCLDACATGVERDASGEQLREAVCIAVFVAWLGRQCADQAGRARGLEILERLTPQVVASHQGGGTAAVRSAMAALLACRRYFVTARQMVAEIGDDAPDIALLVVPPNPALAASFLQAAALHCERQAFPPALYFYCDALLGLGKTREVENLLNAQGSDPADPMIADLRARICEQAGNWRAAYEIYRNSTSWPSHSYRAAMTGIIAGAISDRDQGVLVVDDAIEKELQVASSEIDQAEIVRRSNFLAVCRALAFDNWIVRYELAQLGFRRRQHASADSNFRIAATRCPARARFAVLQAQWVNLTWLSHSRGGHVSLHPEALEAGYAAIQAAGPHDRPAAGAIQVWLATNAPDLDVMDPVDVEAAGPYTRGLASEALGDGVGAIRCWLRALETSYEPRAAHKLIELCERCNFTQTVQGIVDLLLRESNDDFFALWELGKVLLWQRRARELTSGHLDQKIRIIAERLEVMSRYEFQHLMRAFEFFTLQNREDRAASMLARAASLAEGFEDNLSVAIERRNLLAPTDVIGRRCLQRAAREAGERFEKLQVARELFAYGETRRAREILTELGAFRDCGDFDHAERIIVLQCAHWLGEDEAGRFACETAESLRWASGHGAFSRYGNAFWKRLHENVTKSQVKRFDAATLEWWKEQMSLNGGQPKRGIAEVELHDDMMGRISAQPLEWNLHAWSYVANELDTTFAGLAKVQPTAEESETPTSESIDTASDWRGQEISDRWRSYFAAKTDADASLKLDAVRQFFVEEARLVELWEAKRRVARAPFLGLVTRFAGFASRILESLSESRDELEKWPMLAGFFQNVRTDAAIQRQRIEARLPALASDPCTPEVAPEIAT